MKLLKITVDEESILKSHFKKSPIALIRHKAQAVLMKSQGFTFPQIANCIFKSIRQISRWIKDFEDIRLGSLFSGYVDNENASKVTNKQKRSIKRALKHPPSKYGIPKDFWGVPELRTYVQARFGVVYESKQSYHFLLKFCNLSFKYPDTFSIRRDEKLIKTRMKEIRKEIKPYLKDPEWEVFAVDEVRIILEAITRQAWLNKGKRTILKVIKSKEGQSYFGALNQKTFQCHVFELEWQDQERIIPAIEKLIALYPNKKICIVWDNATFHKGTLIREALKKGNVLERVHLINFPPYAPDHNPIERVWNTTKKDLSNQQFDSLETTKAMFLEKVNARKFDYKI